MKTIARDMIFLTLHSSFVANRQLDKKKKLLLKTIKCHFKLVVDQTFGMYSKIQPFELV